MTVNASQSIVKESNCKPNKICFEKDIEFYNKSMQSWLEGSKVKI